MRRIYFFYEGAPDKSKITVWKRRGIRLRAATVIRRIIKTLRVFRLPRTSFFLVSIISKVRANIVVALGDLAFRFPNALEPWNTRMYDRLKDACPRVRANAIMVLTHLILNGMVKVCRYCKR